MSTNPRVFVNPFAIPSKESTSNNSKPNTKTSSLTLPPKAAESLDAFINYNPTLSKPSSAHRSSYSSYYTNVNPQKRPFRAINNDSYTQHQTDNNRHKRQKRRNDGGLTDTQYQSIIEARKNETEEDILRYIEQRKQNYPHLRNVQRKREIINVKTKRGQLLSINERIMKYQDDTGNKKTPSVLRFLKTPKFDQNIVRKVLCKEIEREYSAILQCFRHIIKTNYLTTDLNNNDDAQMIDNKHKQINEDGNDNDTTDIIGNECAFDLNDIEKDETMMEQEDDDDDINNDLDNILALENL